jgi:3-hydroxyisobutyrate dehydrogenase-like beta-hydroxyacid dehydrogenase
MKQVGFVGLGTMGGPMAMHLLRERGSLVVWNRSSGKSDVHRAAGAHVAQDLAEVGQQCEVVVLCVNRSEDVKSCLSEMVDSAKPGTLFIDHSTILPEAAKQIGQELRDAGFRFVDAPITGGSMGAQKGTLTVFLGGSEEDVSESLEIIRPYSKTAERVGDIGQGQLMKMANQIAVGGALMALCECLAFAQKGGLDIAQARALINTGAGGSWAFENYGAMIMKRDWTPGFSIKNQRKDFGYCFETAAGIGATLPGTQVVDHLLGRLQDAGLGELTTAKLFDLLVEAGASQ